MDVDDAVNQNSEDEVDDEAESSLEGPEEDEGVVYEEANEGLALADSTG